MRPHPQIHGEGIFAGEKIRCILVHDHVLVRQGLRRLLEDETELEVVAEAGTATDALQQVFEQHPDVVLADAATMGFPADDAEKMILREWPAARVLFLGMRGDLEGDEIGVPVQNEVGIVPPQTSANELVAMVKGRSDAPKSRIHEVPRTNERGWFSADAPSSKKRGLTSREREVLKLLAQGQTVRSAAGTLGVSAKTVDAHKFNLMRKLGIHNKAELVMWAIQKRVVKLPVNL